MNMIELISVVFYVIPTSFLLISIPNIINAIRELKFNLTCFKCISFWIAIILSQDVFIAGWCAILAIVLDSLMVVRL